MNRRLDTLVRNALQAVQAGALKPVTALPPLGQVAGWPVRRSRSTATCSTPTWQLLLRLSAVIPDRTQRSIAARREQLRAETRLISGTPRELDARHRAHRPRLRPASSAPGCTCPARRRRRTAGCWFSSTAAAGASATWTPTTVTAGRSRTTPAVRLLAVDYRLAPEAEAPAGAEDAVAAFCWAVDHAADLGADPARIGVGGDSAGGNLAAVVAQQTVRRELPAPALQLLIYPGLDLVGRRSSRDLFRDGFYLTEADINFYRDHYTPDPAIRTDPIVSPLLAADLSGLAPAHIVTAGFDPLRDEGDEYAEKLAAAGVPVRYVCETSMFHGFASIMVICESARLARLRIAHAVHEALAP